MVYFCRTDEGKKISKFISIWLKRAFLSWAGYFTINLQFLAVLRIRIRIRIRSNPVFFGHPDPDPGKYRIRILYPQKTPCYSNFLVIKLCKTQFRPYNFLIFDFKWHNNFLSLILSVIWCLDLVRKCHKKYLFC